MKKVKNLILGAGLSGISFALFSKEKDYLILEKTNHYGGYCQTFKVKDFIWDYAGHFYHFKTDELRKLFLKEVEENEKIIREKDTKIYYKNELIDFPFQMNIHQLPKEEFIDCLYDLYTKSPNQDPKDFLEMLYGKFGKSITEKFLKPYNEKLYAIDLKKLDKDAMGRFFPHADFDAIIKNMKKSEINSYNANFWYLKQGTQYFIDKLYKKIDSEKVIYNANVVKIDLDKKIVETEDGSKYQYENLINTIPLNNALDKIGSYPKLVDEMSYNKVLVFNIGFKKGSKKFKNEHWLYFPDKDLNFYRVGFYNNILGQDKLSLYVELGFSKGETPNVEKEYKEVIKNLEKVGIKDKDNDVDVYNSIIMDPAYVHISGPTQEKLDKLLKELKQKNFYTLGRYGKWTYNSMEDSMLWAKELAEEIGKAYV